MIATLLWGLGAVLVVLKLYAAARWIFSVAQQTYERYTAPTITVTLPTTQFDAAPAPTPLTPVVPGKPDIIQCYDKGTNVPLGTVRVVQKDALQLIVSRAREAQVQWAKTPFSTRRRLLFSLTEYVLSNQRLICQTASIEGGKTLMDGALGEILTTLEKLRWTAANGEDVLAEEVRDVGLIALHKRAALAYRPIGVIGAIVSWNYPFHNIYGPMISALFAGNAFIGKVSEYSSFYARYFEEIVRDGLRKLGQNPDLVSFITGFAQTGEALVELADKVTFIGSPGVGKKVMERASRTLTPVILELGGKDPAVICEDADLDQVIPIIMRGTFQNCGQNCAGLERIVAHAAVYDKLQAALLERVKALKQGPASAGVCDLGAMTMGQASVDKITKLVKDSVAAGAKLLIGGSSSSPNFFPPTMLVDVTPEMAVSQEEIFGPVLVMMKFRSDEEAIEMVNKCPYGLGSSVFTANVGRGQRIADQLRAGMTNVNDFGINYLCQSLPFGGVGISGFDRFAGVEGLRGNCNLRSQTRDRIPGVKTLIPPVLQYPIRDAAFSFMEALTHTLFGTMTQSVQGAIKLATSKP